MTGLSTEREPAYLPGCVTGQRLSPNYRGSHRQLHYLAGSIQQEATQSGVEFGRGLGLHAPPGK